MRSFQTIKKLVCLAFILACTIAISYGQDSAKGKNSRIKDKITNRKFTFVAESVTPMGAAFRPLTSYYDIKVSKDTIISNLPYFGRAYSAPINPSEGGLSFTSTKFEYAVNKQKKGGYQVTVKPREMRDVQQLFFTIFDNGSASLQVTSNNRQPISFNGHIKEGNN